MITNPEYLPKDRLKTELKKRGVSFSPNENKDYYVQLYRDEVMGGKAREKVRSEFSSDEEFIRQSPRPSRKQHKQTPAKSKKAAAKIDTYLPQVETLTDKALTEQLQSYGENVGPVTGTTRTVYERKLAKLMATGEGGKSQPSSDSHEQVDHQDKIQSFIGEWTGDEESDTTEESEAAPPPQQRASGRLHSKKHHAREDKGHSVTPLMSKGVEEAELRQRPKPSSSKPRSSKHPRPSSSYPKSAGSSNIWSLLCSLLLIALMFAIAFLVYEHYTCPEEQDSLILTGWKKAGVYVVQMREMILKELPADDFETTEAPPTAPPTPEDDAPPKKKKSKKTKKAPPKSTEKSE